MHLKLFTIQFRISCVLDSPINFNFQLYDNLENVILLIYFALRFTALKQEHCELEHDFVFKF
jgi:hypothetical protein